MEDYVEDYMEDDVYEYDSEDHIGIDDIHDDEETDEETDEEEYKIIFDSLGDEGYIVAWKRGDDHDRICVGHYMDAYRLTEKQLLASFDDNIVNTWVFRGSKHEYIKLVRNRLQHNMNVSDTERDFYRSFEQWYKGSMAK